MNTTKRALFMGLLAIGLALSAHAQVNALDFAYGIGTVAPLRVINGPYAIGSPSITVSQGYTVSASGITFSPLSTLAPVLVGSGASQETLTPTAVSCTTPALYGTCSFTVTTTKAHGTGDLVQSSTVGLQEAINYQVLQGGGDVTVNRAWVRAGGTTTLITAASASPIVPVRDQRNVSATQYWSMQPSTLTSLAVPATLVAGTVVFAAAPVGTWANSAYYFCVTYVDALGGEGPCSLTYTQTPTLNYSVTITAPAASTGAVGWRFYAGTGSLATAYLMPIDSTHCTLTTLEVVMPACAMGSNGGWIAPPVTTTILKPNTQTSPTVNVNQPLSQSHTTFAYAPTGGLPVPFQTHYGPFPAYGALTAGQVANLGTVNLPAGYLNVIGRTIRISGKIALTTLNTATLPYITIGLGWVGGLTAGAPIAVCSLVPAAAGATATANETFSCTITTNAVGATAVATAMTNGYELLAAAAGGALTGATVDTGTAAIGSLGFFAQDTLFITFTSTTNVVAGEQLLDLHVETMQ